MLLLGVHLGVNKGWGRRSCALGQAPCLGEIMEMK